VINTAASAKKEDILLFMYRFLMNLIGQSEGDKVSGMVHL